MFKKGYLLTEVVISIAILAILLPMIYKTLIKTIKVGLEMKEVLQAYLKACKTKVITERLLCAI